MAVVDSALTWRDTGAMRSIGRAVGMALFVPVLATLVGATTTGLGSAGAGSGVEGRVVPCGLVLVRMDTEVAGWPSAFAAVAG